LTWLSILAYTHRPLFRSIQPRGPNNQHFGYLQYAPISQRYRTSHFGTRVKSSLSCRSLMASQSDLTKSIRASVARMEEVGTHLNDLEMPADYDTPPKDPSEKAARFLADQESKMRNIATLEKVRGILVEGGNATAGDETLRTLQDALEGLADTFKSLSLGVNSFQGITNSLLRRLNSLVRSDAPEDENKRYRSRLQADIDLTMQFLKLCKLMNEIQPLKIYKIGEVMADGGSDQEVVTMTTEDHLDIMKEGNSAQSVGSGTTNPDGDGDLIVVNSVDL